MHSFIRAPHIGSKNAIVISIDANIAEIMNLKKKILESKKNKKKYFLKISLEEIENG